MTLSALLYMVPSPPTPGVNHSPLALLTRIKLKGQRLLAETSSYFALTVVISSFVRLLQVPTVYEQVLIPWVTKYQMCIQSFHVLVGFHTQVGHKDSQGVATTLSGQKPPSVVPHNSTLRLHAFFLAVAIILQTATKLMFTFNLGPAANWGLLTDFVYICGGVSLRLSLGEGSQRAVMRWFIDIPALSQIWKMEYLLPPILVLVYVAWFRRCVIARFPAAQASTSIICCQADQARRGSTLSNRKRQQASAYCKSLATLWQDQNQLRRCLLVLSVHIIIAGLGFSVACIWMAAMPLAYSCISSLRRYFHRLRSPLTAGLDKVQKPTKRCACIRFIHLTLWIWPILEVSETFLMIVVIRQAISKSQNTPGLAEWGIGQVAAIVAWLPMIVAFVELLSGGAISKHTVFPFTFHNSWLTRS